MFGGLIDYQNLYPKVFEIPFNSNNKYQISIHEYNKNNQFNGYRILMKGAPEIILSHCKNIYIDHKSIPLSEFWQKKCCNYLREMTRLGHRVIGFCDHTLDIRVYEKNYEFRLDEFGKLNFPISNMRFLGLISMSETPRVGVAEAVEKCKRAGVKVIMITGKFNLIFLDYFIYFISLINLTKHKIFRRSSSNSKSFS
jgi:magnesium-transporting ATPase (P-type)